MPGVMYMDEPSWKEASTLMPWLWGFGPEKDWLWKHLEHLKSTTSSTTAGSTEVTGIIRLTDQEKYQQATRREALTLVMTKFLNLVGDLEAHDVPLTRLPEIVIGEVKGYYSAQVTLTVTSPSTEHSKTDTGHKQYPMTIEPWEYQAYKDATKTGAIQSAGKGVAEKKKTGKMYSLAGTNPFYKNSIPITNDTININHMTSSIWRPEEEWKGKHKIV